MGGPGRGVGRPGTLPRRVTSLAGLLARGAALGAPSSAGRAGGVPAPWGGGHWRCLSRARPALSQAQTREFLFLWCLVLNSFPLNSTPHRIGFKNRINSWPEVMGRERGWSSCPSKGPSHAPPRSGVAPQLKEPTAGGWRVLGEGVDGSCSSRNRGCDSGPPPGRRWELVTQPCPSPCSVHV